MYEPETPTDKAPLESQWHPVYDQTVNRQSVKLIAHFYARHGDPVAAPSEIKGLIRRAGLEQLPSYVRKRLTEQGLVVEKNALYIDVGARPSDELMFFVGVMSLLCGLGGGVVWSLHRRRVERVKYLARLKSKSRSTG